LLATDSEGIVTAWSPAAESLLGYRALEVVGRPIDRILADHGSAPWLRQAPEPGGQATPGEATQWTGSLDFAGRRGEVLSLPVHAGCLWPAGGGGPWSIVGLAPEPPGPQDAMDAALLRWLYEHSPIALAVYTDDLSYVRQSAAMARLTGLPEEERHGTRPAHALAGPEGIAWEQRLREAVGKGSDVPRQEVHGRVPASPDRESVFVTTAGSLTDGAGRTIGLCSTLIDVTEYRRARQRLTLLNEASTRIGTTLDLSATARELVEVLCPQLADWAHIDLLESVLRGEEPGPFSGAVALHRAAHKSFRPGAPEAVRTLGGVDVFPADSPPVRCMATGRSMVLATSDPQTQAWLAADPQRAERFAQHGYHSVMVVPVAARGTILGGAVLLRSRLPPFDEDDRLLTEELVSRAAVCLDNSRRYARERDTALALQRSLLPQRPPQPTAAEVTSRYLPAGSGAGVGGDWFDVIPLSGARVALVLGDVVGHGINAAATMGRLRTAVRTLADVDLPPDELLTHLDDVLTSPGVEDRNPDGGGELGATCVYAVYDPISLTCALATAGHPPPAVVLPDGTATIPDMPAGPPLGVGGLPFESVELALPEGSLLALYSDGLLDVRHRDVDEAQAALCRSLSGGGQSLDDLCSAMIDRLLPARPADDATLLLAKTRALHPGQVAVLDVPHEASFVAEARAWTALRLAEWGLAASGFVTELVVSELVTNAIRYGRQPVHLRLIHDRTLICEVSDSSTTAPHLRRARLSDEGGRGLLLVAQLTQRWGTRHSRHGKTIWCEQRTDTDA
jgi:serine phosphatase RsbU (regulator of sigma subunit)/PAS domain-containing protein/anti-sigma regulatory factor (Ser/Thr protein kinase)